IISICNQRAMGPDVWNDWKRLLIAQLYALASTALKGESSAALEAVYAKLVSERRASALALVEEAKRADAQRLAAIAPVGFWTALQADQAARYLSIMLDAEASGGPVVLTLPRPEFDVTEVFVYAPDQPSLFTSLTGALAAGGASIRTAMAFTFTDGWAADVFGVQDAADEAYGAHGGLERVEELIRGSLSGEIDPGGRLPSQRVRQRERAFDVRSSVTIDNEASNTATVVEIVGRDRPGLLHDLAIAFADLGVSILSAHIATYGERVVDVFYVQDVPAHKITDRRRMEAVRRRLKAALLEPAD
ncbi:MAG: ACT domain-containing protein, partial [Pseudomonadota bacterium]